MHFLLDICIKFWYNVGKGIETLCFYKQRERILSMAMNKKKMATKKPAAMAKMSQSMRKGYGKAPMPKKRGMKGC